MANGFDDISDDINPFADPSVIAAANAAPLTTVSGVRSESIPGMQSTEPSQGQIFSLPPMETIRSTSTGVSLPKAQEYSSFSDNRNLLSNQAELDRRARDLDEKERQLAERERLQAEAMQGYHPPNFPPFPRWFCLKPCFYINIDDEVPESNRKLCRQLYYQWIAYCAILAFDLFCAMAIIISTGPSNAGTIVFAILLCPLFCILSFLFCFRPVYIALKSSSSFNFILFFGCYGIQIGVNIIQTLGIHGSGWAGFINGAKLLEDKVFFAGYICLICGFGFLSLSIFGIVMLRFIWGIYKGSGASMQQAQSEFTAGAWKLGGKSVFNTITTSGRS